ncbi:hypothetical protein TpMuguga_02g00299 [Theileria parva strain Muguga]|uniref:uncharacterized protein n=1 Tax=Theileria parva strain Muguga TaxID=333668 RepID=UPI001C6178FF|nr:uncharacterized protein TpMuguga_02g00299 [Theileria parva strain Muguga]EAN32582.2 hypothetical protein TpMuguga_02g00299 [Theileria parva strain Muguga]
MSNILELDKARKDVELEMEALMSYLNSEECKYVGLNGPLVDDDQFPRNDIDIYEVRKARGRIMCLKNDYEKLTEEIEKLLHELHKQHRNKEVNNKMNS